MNAKTLEAIKRHGEALLAAFPDASEKDPVALCKKLRRIEAAISKPILDYCNGDNGLTDEKLSVLEDKAQARVSVVLGESCNLFVNRDPRGHALKLGSGWTTILNSALLSDGKPAIITDMGGYGILAPDLNQA